MSQERWTGGGTEQAKAGVAAVKLLAPSAASRESGSSERSEDAAIDDELAQALQEPFGWPELQMDIIREAIAVAEALPGTWLIEC